MSGNVTVSVLMPVYNAAGYVAESIESVLRQTLTDFELLITDDGSTDNSLEILKRYAQQDNRIRLFSRPNRGLTPTLNEMIEKVRGEFVAILENDDIAVPERLEMQVNFLREREDHVCVGGAQKLIDDKGRFLTRLSLPQEDAEIQNLALRGQGGICHPGATIRRTALVEVGGYDEEMSLAHDLDLFLRLGEIGKLANLAAPVISYRLHDKSLSERKRIEQQEEARVACERAWKRRGIRDGQFAYQMWRPGPDLASRHKFALKYGWWAFNSAQRETAVSYGLKALRLRPFALSSWQLFLASLLKKSPLHRQRTG